MEWIMPSLKFLLLLLLPFLNESMAATNSDDVQALQSLYYSVNPVSALTGWVFANGADPCADAWKGIQCTGPAVTGINLSGLGLSGWLNDLSKFSSLTSMDISQNQISGSNTLPTSLQSLNIAYNSFQGSLPSTISSLTSLVYLYAGNNSLSGSLPDMFSNLGNLSILDLSFNTISGQLPQSISMLYNLNSLYLQYNEFTGSLDVLANLNLQDLNIEHNKFTGWIPASFSSIQNLKYDGNSFSTSPAPPPPPFTPPPPSPTKSNSQSSSLQNTSATGNESDMSVGTIAGIVIACLLGVFVIALIAVFLFWKPRSSINDQEKHQSPNQVLALLPSRGSHAQITGSESMVSFLPIDTVLKPPPSETRKESILERVSRKSSLKRKNQISAISYSISDLQLATDNFSDDNLLSEGALGHVYRAEFSNGQILAVNEISISLVEQEDDFMEIVSSISGFRHSNISELVGYCGEHGQRLLVHDYFNRGSLHDMLHVVEDARKRDLTWNTRVKIALGTARAIEYLHEVRKPAVVHKNVTSSNILLSEELDPHLSGCWMHALPDSEFEVEGSFGYHALEFTMSGVYTWQSDVYSFGVVMLELLTGRKPFDSTRSREEQSLVRWATPQLHDIDALETLVDPSLDGMYHVKSLSRFADIISLCVQTEMEFRPPMSEVVQSLLRLMQRANSKKRSSVESLF